MAGTISDEVRARVEASLARMGLLGEGEHPAIAALGGGISSDIWRVDLAAGPVCLKCALPKLRVTAEWRAPVARNRFEVAWMEVVSAIIPGAVPAIVGDDPGGGVFAMRYLAPGDHPLWKEQLRDGHADPAVAAAVGDRLGHIHAATAGDAAIAERFASDDVFFAMRIEPYLLATARAHPERAAILETLAATTANTKKVLVHGDISPKNIVNGPHGPVFLDAECAWYGEPAFDLAFCLNHFLLKCLWTPAASPDFLRCFESLTKAYFARVDWEPPEALERRVAHLLGGLFLARVDGKSPVEYVTDAGDKDRVRRVAGAMLDAPPPSLAAFAAAWAAELGL